MNDELNKIIKDLKLLFAHEKITGQDFDEFLGKLDSQTVKDYLEALRNRAQPEQALKNSFFSVIITFRCRVPESVTPPFAMGLFNAERSIDTFGLLKKLLFDFQSSDLLKKEEFNCLSLKLSEQEIQLED